MRPLKKGLIIKADSEVYLKPSGYHIMFIGLKEQISKGKEYKATLNFENAGSVDIFKAVGRNYHPDKITTNIINDYQAYSSKRILPSILVTTVILVFIV